MDRLPVELVRVPKEEQYFDREEVLGRDLTSVFPTELKKAAMQSAGLAELLGGGNRKFISETELEDIKTKRGLSGEDGTMVADKPLAEILREAKEAKQTAFEDQWKTMKQGKNRPLDEDEFEFVDNIAQQEADTQRRQRAEEEAELAEFYAARRGQQGATEAGPDLGGADSIVGLAEQQPGVAFGPAAAAGKQHAVARAAPEKKQLAKKPPLMAIKPIVRPVIKAKAVADADSGGAGPAAKRQKAEGGMQQQGGGSSGSEGEGPGLAGLLGGYGSDSDG